MSEQSLPSTGETFNVFSFWKKREKKNWLFLFSVSGMTVNLHSTCTGADYPDLYHWWCISPLAIEPGQSHWQNLFAVTRFRLIYRGSISCISILGCKGNRSFLGLCYIEVRSSKFPAVFARGVFLGILSKRVPPGSS